MNVTVFNSTAAFSSHRLEEKHFGDEIFRNIHALTLLQKPSETLMAMLSRDMFIKANTKAFPHVMHFLFTILIDPREFRKHFYWPIIDKTGETNFRTAAMTQMNNLIKKHHLKLEPIKMHIVVLPGGLKFMKILYEFTILAMKETIAKHSRGEENILAHPLNTNCQLEEKRSRDIFELSKSMVENTKLIREEVHKVEETINIFSGGLTLAIPFLDSWKTELDEQITSQIEPMFKAISSFAKECSEINDQVQAIATNRHKQFVAVDKDELKQCQTQLSTWLTSNDMQNTIRNLFVSNGFNYANVIKVFEAVLPAIVYQIESFNYRRLDNEIVQFESGIIDDMCVDVLTLKTESDAQLKRAEKHFDYVQNKYPLVKNKENETPNEQSHLRFINTPPIRMRPNGTNSILQNHIPWKFDENTKIVAPSSAIKANRSIINASTRSLPGNQNKLNSSMTGSIVPGQSRANAMTMLNMVRQRCTNRADNRTRQEHTAHTLQVPKKTHLQLESPTTTTGSKSKSTTSAATFYPGLGSTRVYTEKLFESSTIVSPDTIVLRQRHETNQVIRIQSTPENTSHMQAHDAHFLRTSPTGRFIMPDAHPSQTLSHLDDTVSKTDNTLLYLSKTDNTTLCEATPISNERTVIEVMAADGGGGASSNWNNATARKILFSPEVSPKRAKTMIESNDAAVVVAAPADTVESLFNVSDSVLQDLNDSDSY